MTLMQSFPFDPARRRVRRKRRSAGAAPAPGPVLVAVYYNDEEPSIDLVFGAPVDASAFDTTKVALDDSQVLEASLAGIGAADVISPTALRVSLTLTGSAEHPGTHLTVGPGNGLVAADTGTPWPGVSELAVPYP